MAETPLALKRQPEGFPLRPRPHHHHYVEGGSHYLNCLLHLGDCAMVDCVHRKTHATVKRYALERVDATKARVYTTTPGVVFGYCADGLWRQVSADGLRVEPRCAHLVLDLCKHAHPQLDSRLLNQIPRTSEALRLPQGQPTPLSTPTPEHEARLPPAPPRVINPRAPAMEPVTHLATLEELREPRIPQLPRYTTQ